MFDFSPARAGLALPRHSPADVLAGHGRYSAENLNGDLIVSLNGK
jgi:hypothetical protein